MRSPFFRKKSSRLGGKKKLLVKKDSVNKNQEKEVKKAPEENQVEESRNPNTSVRTTTARMAAASKSQMSIASDTKTSEYEGLRDDEITPGGGCQMDLDEGTEAVTTCGEVMTEVFDLVNEIAFPEVMDQAAKEAAKEKKESLMCGSTSYKDDDDSLFNRSDSFKNCKDAKEFLCFIGAMKPNNKTIVSTPTAPIDLLVPNGIPLGVTAGDKSIMNVKTDLLLTNAIPLSPPPEGQSLFDFTTIEKEEAENDKAEAKAPVEVEKEEAKNDEAEAKAKAPVEVEKKEARKVEVEAETRDNEGDGNGNHEENKADEENDDGSVEKSRSERSSLSCNADNSRSNRSSLTRSSRRRSPDRYSSIDGSHSGEEWSCEGKEAEDDWCTDKTAETRSVGKYKSIISDVSSRSNEEQSSTSATKFKIKGAARIKSTIQQGFQRGTPNFINVGGSERSERSELLTIVESSDEDENTSEEGVIRKDVVEEGEDESSLEQEEKFEKLDKYREANDVEYIEEVNDAVVDPQDKEQHPEIENGDKTNDANEEEYSNRSPHESSYSSYDEEEDNRTYISYESAGDDDSFLNLEEGSDTRHSSTHHSNTHHSSTHHSKFSTGAEDHSVFYEIGAADSLLDESVTHHSNWVESSYEEEYEEEEYCDESVSRDSRSAVSSEVESITEHENFVGAVPQSGESAKVEPEQKDDNIKISDAKKSIPSLKMPEPSRCCSIYDNLYPSDSLFSFGTQDETNQDERSVDLSESTLQQQKIHEVPPSLLMDDESSTDENEDDEVPPENEDENEKAVSGMDAFLEDYAEEQRLQAQMQEDKVKIDEDHQECSHKNSIDPRDNGNEKRDGVAGQGNGENETEGEAPASTIKVKASTISTQVASAVECETKESTESPKQHPATSTKPPVYPQRERNTEEGEVKKTTKGDDDSHSNRSRSVRDDDSQSNRSTITHESNETMETDSTTEQVEQASIAKPQPANSALQRRKGRQLTRVRMYNQHRQTIHKLHQQSE